MHDSIIENIKLIDNKIYYYLVFHDEIEIRKLVNTQVAQDELLEYNAQILANDLRMNKAEA